MPTLAFGLNSYTSGDFLDKLQIAFGIQLAERRGTSGVVAKVKAFNPTNDVTINGGGASGFTAGLVTPTITGLSGGVMYLKKDDYTEPNVDFNDFASSITHYPGAADAG